MSVSDLYKELGTLTKEKDKWEASIPYVSSLLNHESVKIRAKALWLLGETGLEYPLSIQNSVSAISSFCDSPVPLLRERAVNALGRIGRGNYQLIEPYWPDLFRFADDEDSNVRLSFIWASENIATNTPDIYQNNMPVFEKLLHDPDDKVRMEAPEIFRVLGKRRPEFVMPYIGQLQTISETDENRVVRIHCSGAVKACITGQKKKKEKNVEIVGNNYYGKWDKTRTACRGIIIRDNRLLLSYETLTGQWMLPGGGLEAGEDEHECCIREVAEETGFLIRPTECVLEIDEYYEDFRWVNRYFFGEVTGETAIHLTEREKEVGMEPRWLPLDEIIHIFSEYASYADSDEMRRGMYLREYTALSKLFGGVSSGNQNVTI